MFKLLQKPLTGVLLLGFFVAGCASGTRPIVADGQPETAFGHYVAGQHARQIRDSRAAARYYLEALQRDPENRLLLNRAFMLLLTDGRYREALRLAERIVEESPGAGAAAILLTLDSLKSGRFEAGRARLERVSGTGFESLISPIVLAWLHAGDGDAYQAIDALEPLGAISSLRSYQDAHTAYIYDYLGRADDADRAYRRVVNSSRLASLQPVVAYGDFLVRADRTPEAGALYIEFLERYPDNEFLKLAAGRFNAGESAGSAPRTPAQAVALALFGAASELGRENARRPAIIYARFTAFLDPDFDEVHILLGNLLLNEEHYDTAIEAFRRVPPSSPLRETAQLREAWVHDRRGDTDAAIAMLEAFVADRPDHVEALSTLGDILRGQERFDEAGVRYTAAIDAIDALGEASEKDWFIYFTRGIAYERTKQWPKAEADFFKALELKPDQPQVLNYLGYSWIDRGMHIQRAKAMIERAVEQRPNDGYIVDSLGWVHYLLGNYEQAVSILERAVLLQPSDPTISDHLGDAYWKAGRPIEARFQWSHALENDPTPEQRELIADKLDFGLTLAEAAQD